MPDVAKDGPTGSWRKVAVWSIVPASLSFWIILWAFPQAVFALKLGGPIVFVAFGAFVLATLALWMWFVLAYARPYLRDGIDPFESKGLRPSAPYPCPYCLEEVKPGAVVCPHCHQTFPQWSPVTKVIYGIIFFLAVWFAIRLWALHEATKYMREMNRVLDTFQSTR